MLFCLIRAGQPAEVIHPPIGLEQIVHRRYAPRDVDLAAGTPESFPDGDGADWDIAQLGIGRLC